MYYHVVIVIYVEKNSFQAPILPGNWAVEVLHYKCPNGHSMYKSILEIKLNSQNSQPTLIL